MAACQECERLLHADWETMRRYSEAATWLARYEPDRDNEQFSKIWRDFWNFGDERLKNRTDLIAHFATHNVPPPAADN